MKRGRQLTNKRLANNRLALTIGAMVALAVINLTLLAWPPLLTKAGPTLPPRNPLPIEDPDRDDNDDGDTRLGAYIELKTPAGTWAVVQWQDSAGGWHDVEGWRGSLHNGTRRWWVEAGDFGRGPFRWVVSQGPEGAVIGISEPFSLPVGSHQVVFVTVSP